MRLTPPEVAGGLELSQKARAQLQVQYCGKKGAACALAPTAVAPTPEQAAAALQFVAAALRGAAAAGWAAGEAAPQAAGSAAAAGAGAATAAAAPAATIAAQAPAAQPAAAAAGAAAGAEPTLLLAVFEDRGSRAPAAAAPAAASAAAPASPQPGAAAVPAPAIPTKKQLARLVKEAKQAQQEQKPSSKERKRLRVLELAEQLGLPRPGGASVDLLARIGLTGVGGGGAQVAGPGPQSSLKLLQTGRVWRRFASLVSLAASYGCERLLSAACVVQLWRTWVLES